MEPGGFGVWSRPTIFPPLLVERSGVRVERRLPAEMGVEHGRAGCNLARPHEVDERGHGFALVDRVGDHALEPCTETDRLERVSVGNAVATGVPAVEQADLAVAQFA